MTDNEATEILKTHRPTWLWQWPHFHWFRVVQVIQTGRVLVRGAPVVDVEWTEVRQCRCGSQRVRLISRREAR